MSPAHAIAWLEAAAILLAAPLLSASALSGSGRRRASAALTAGVGPVRIVAALVGAGAVRVIAGLLLAALALSGLSIAGRGPSLADVAALQLMLGVIAVAVLALGLALSVCFGDALESAGLTFLAIAAGVLAFLLAGPFIARSADASGLIRAVLIVNPFAGVASVLDADPLRGEILYQLSPIGQRRFEYPAPWMVGSAYAAAAIVFAAGASWRIRSCAACNP